MFRKLSIHLRALVESFSNWQKSLKLSFPSYLAAWSKIILPNFRSKCLISILLLRKFKFGNIIFDLAAKYDGKLNLSDFRQLEKLSTKARKWIPSIRNMSCKFKWCVVFFKCLNSEIVLCEGAENYTTSNELHALHSMRDLNKGHIGWRQVLSEQCIKH